MIAIDRIDHLVLTVSGSKTAAAEYERNFGLKATTAAMNERYYAFLKVGETTIAIVGPIPPEPGPVTGGLWGLAFHSADLDATIAHLEKAGVTLKPPHRAQQGGHITGLPLPLGGIQIAFIGE